MEEIAFGVLSAAYEEWSYDDTNSEVSSMGGVLHPPRTNGKTLYCKQFPPCQAKFTKIEHLIRHIE